MFSAIGDVVSAIGDVVSAIGDVFSAIGDEELTIVCLTNTTKTKTTRDPLPPSTT